MHPEKKHELIPNQDNESLQEEMTKQDKEPKQEEAPQQDVAPKTIPANVEQEQMSDLSADLKLTG